MAVIELKAKQLFVKSSFKEGKTPEFYEDTELYYNENAFSSITDAYSYCKENNIVDAKIIILDGSTAINEEMITEYISSLNAEDDIEASAVSKGTLKINADFNGDVRYFKTVNIVSASVDGIIFGNLNEKSAGALTFKIDKKADADKNYSIGEVSYFANVTLTGISDKNLVKGLAVNGNITGGTLDKTGLPTVTGTLKATNGVDITGNVSGFKTVTLTNSSVEGSITGSTNGKSVGSFTLKVDKKADLTKDYGVSGDISGFTNVTLNGLNDKKLGFKFAAIGGSIYGGTVANEVLTAAGTLKATNALINNNVTGFKTVTLTNSVVLGIDAYGTKGSTVNLTDAVGCYIKNVNKVNVKKGISSVSYSGTEMSDTFSIAKNATCYIYEEINLGENDKFVLNGTAVFYAGASLNTSGTYTLSGSGEIAADTETLANLKSQIELPAKSKVKFVDLGVNTENFTSSTFEKADDTAKKARKVDDITMGVHGWLNGDTSGATLSDTADYFKFTAKKSGTLSLDYAIGEVELVLYDTKTKQEITDFDGTVAAGSTYVIGIKCKEETDISFAYSIGFAEV